MHIELILSSILSFKLLLDKQSITSKNIYIIYIAILIAVCGWLFNRLVSTIDKALLLLILTLQIYINIMIIRTPSINNYNKSMILTFISLLLVFKFIHDKYILKKEHCNVV